VSGRWAAIAGIDPAAAPDTVAATLRLVNPRIAELTHWPVPIWACLLDGRQEAAAQAGVIHRLLQARGIPTCGFGSGATVTIAALAAHTAGTGGVRVVPAGGETAFLAPLPLALLPLDATLLARLQLFGLRTLGAVAALPRDALEAQFGEAGRQLAALVRGEDVVQPLPIRPDPQLILRRRFVGPLADSPLLALALHGLADRLAARLLAGGWATGALTLALDCEDAAPVLAVRVLPAPSCDPARLRATLAALLRQQTLASGVVSLSVAASRLIPLRPAQLALLPPDQGRHADLVPALLRLAPQLCACLLRPRIVDADSPCAERGIAWLGLR
jgi:nucleotidyltransferase/DNA polymerase involved in DNA repair